MTVPRKPDNPVNPCDKLPPLAIAVEEGKKATVVREGTGAIRVNQELLYGVSAAHADKKEAPRRYCKFDTAAKVIIWED